MPKHDVPEILRVSYVDAARDAAAAFQRRDDHPDRPQRLSAAAVTLAPLQSVQHVLDGLVRVANDIRDGHPDPHNLGVRRHAEDALAHARTHRDTLRAAADAADAMIEAARSSLEPIMASEKKDKDKGGADVPAPTTTDPAHRAPSAPDTRVDPDSQEPPQLTTSGAPHPLQAGGYDPDADPQLSGNISDIEALKEGKGTRAEAEAIGEADAEAAKERAKAAKAAEKGHADKGHGPAHGHKK